MIKIKVRFVEKPKNEVLRNSRRTETSMRSSHRPAECGVRLSKIT
jgi:hypothetical protein